MLTLRSACQLTTKNLGLHKCISKTVISALGRRGYHSENYETSKISGKKALILENALEHVPQLGFTEDAIVQGGQALGYSNLSKALFPSGPMDLISYFFLKQRYALSSLKPHLTTIPETSGRVVQLIWSRLQGNRDIVQHLPQMIAICTYPSNLRKSLSSLAELSDEILYLAQDKSADFQWYTKRAAISAIYSASELFMSRDTSPNFEATYNFVQHRIQHAKALNDLRNDVLEWGSFQLNAVRSILRSRGI
ncbi:Ubiquinone biosynthesis protein coq9, mitochondrial [Schizosaccharomyces pombe]|uniref:Ubiquinone biosynthesis protein coq9, mitochondrial n=1 Tax=Schizosaccharomyces pombe (strain 972 / ATCC 24843) TaxID=284812 RepID=COQ9_SCHPO|nr:putative ubiquinone biosynthesis protein Coq9 [Schizosaccharomyces pombe]O13850.1 RecName: Full=Ubiquinone biosynthesis protein coq9, mitochondrial; Flags: Precursor [Schizosaccharomyces pombe 972h-]CAB10122.1 ubiquinone biosynthesis protein Coq9 (predicted) [Schizosaccharomyces pombe]|eukprot:NP_594426.1 putative ubiquinone biosynthesis protein Coq9 [Schizosaccharomyces pombe]